MNIDITTVNDLHREILQSKAEILRIKINISNIKDDLNKQEGKLIAECIKVDCLRGEVNKVLDTLEEKRE